MSNRRLNVIDIETGELVTDGSVYIRSKTQDDGYQKRLEKERYIYSTRDRNWVASYHDPIERISKELSLTETGAIIKLLPYMRFKTQGKLIKDGKPLKQADIQRIFKRGKTATREILRILEEKGVIEVQKEGRANVFYISAEFHEIGNVDESERFTKLYQVRTREITEKLALHEAGILYKILPFFHYERYYLCANPNESDKDNLRYINRKELAQIVGLNEDDVSRTVNKLRDLGALMSTKSGRSVRYLVHPDLMFRQATETEWTKAVREMFDAHRK